MSAYSVFVFIACAAVSLLVIAIVLVGLAAPIYSSQLSRIEERERERVWVGTRVRFLCAIPEQHIEAGETGRVYLVYPGDDLEYWIQTEQAPTRRTKLFESELWQLERV